MILSILTAMATAAAPPSSLVDLRSLERLYYGCENELGRRDVTLFGNGTVRLRDGLHENEQMDLAELGPEELRAFLAELAAADPSARLRDAAVFDQLAGPFQERCRLRVELPGRPPVEHRFALHEVVSLELMRQVRIAERLAARARPADGAHLPDDYYPRMGDVLTNALGDRYRVLWVSKDGLGVELQGIEQPIRMLTAILGLREVFVDFDRE